MENWELVGQLTPSVSPLAQTSSAVSAQKKGPIMYQTDEGSILPLTLSLATRDFEMSCFHDVIGFSP